LLIQAVAFAAIFYIFSYSIPLLYVLIVIFAMTLVAGRFYCGWLCPLGLIMDLEIFVRKALKKRHRLIPDKLSIALHKFRYIILLFFLLLPIVLWLLEPPPNLDFAVVMAQLLAGPFRPYSVLLDPMIPVVVPWTGQLVINQVNFSYPYAQNIITYAGTNIGQIIAIAFVVLTLAGGFFVRRIWCRFCPTGASLRLRIGLRVLGGHLCFVLIRMRRNALNVASARGFVRCKLTMCMSRRVEEYKPPNVCYVCVVWRCVPTKTRLQLKLGKKTMFKSRTGWNHQKVNEEERNEE